MSSYTAFIKDPDDVLDYEVDWAAWLATDTIAAATWAVPAGLTEVAATNTTTTATVWLGGGTAGASYAVVNRIVTAAGRTAERALTLTITAQGSPAYRTSAAAVRAILDTTLSDTQLLAFIRTANTLVTANLAGSALTPAELVEIEGWLAAHFAAIRDPRAQSESFTDAYRVTYQGQIGTGLDATLYGQQAQALDWTGTLRGLAAKRAKLNLI